MMSKLLNTLRKDTRLQIPYARPDPSRTAKRALSGEEFLPLPASRPRQARWIAAAAGALAVIGCALLFGLTALRRPQTVPVDLGEGSFPFLIQPDLNSQNPSHVYIYDMCGGLLQVNSDGSGAVLLGDTAAAVSPDKYQFRITGLAAYNGNLYFTYSLAEAGASRAPLSCINRLDLRTGERYVYAGTEGGSFLVAEDLLYFQVPDSSHEEGFSLKSFQSATGAIQELAHSPYALSGNGSMAVLEDRLYCTVYVPEKACRELYAFPLEGGEAERIETNVDAFSPVYSDGKYVYYTTVEGIAGQGAGLTLRIYAYDPSAGTHRLLAVHPNAHLSWLSDFFTVSPDGYLYYTVGQPGLCRVPLDGSAPPELLEEGDFYAASDTCIFGIEWTPNGKRRSLYSYDVKSHQKQVLLTYPVNERVARLYEEMGDL